MEQDTKKQYTVNGYLFGDPADVEIANQELAKIKYIDKKIERHSAETVLAVYQAALEKKLFRTPVGYGYLHQLQKKLVGLGIERDRIPAIPLYQVYNNNYKTQERAPRLTPKKKVHPDMKKLRYSVWGNVVLVVLVILLFVITITGENANIINYRNAIENEYSQWEDELTAREQVVREKERELGISAE
jgi:hypothetical protein